MLVSLKSASQRRCAWWLLALSAFVLEIVALYMQHFMNLKPCVMCIYERCALFGVMFAGIIGALAPKSPLRFLALLLWLLSAGKGLLLAWRHTDIQLHPSPFNSCDFFVRFPSFLPLDKWLPSVFQATGDCAEKQWQFLQLQMPQWMIIIFAAYLLVAILVLFAQFTRQK